MVQGSCQCPRKTESAVKATASIRNRRKHAICIQETKLIIS
jgi:hypothetical protein